MRILAMIFALCLMGCNTVQGVGQDLESAGKKGEELIKGN